MLYASIFRLRRKDFRFDHYRGTITNDNTITMIKALLSLSIGFACGGLVLFMLYACKLVVLADWPTPAIVIVCAVNLFGIIAVVLAAIKGVTKLNTKS